MAFSNVFDSSLIDYSKDFENNDIKYNKYLSKFAFIDKFIDGMSPEKIVEEIIKYYWNFKYSETEIGRIHNLLSYMLKRDAVDDKIVSGDIRNYLTSYDDFNYGTILNSCSGKGILYNMIRYGNKKEDAQDMIIASLLEESAGHTRGNNNLNISNRIFGANHKKSTLLKIIEDYLNSNNYKLIY